MRGSNPQVQNLLDMKKSIIKLQESLIPNSFQKKPAIQSLSGLKDIQPDTLKDLRYQIEQNQKIIDKLKPDLYISKSIQLNILPNLKKINVWQEKFIPIFDKQQIEHFIKWKERNDSIAYKNFMKEWGWFFGKKTYSFGDYCFGLYKKFGQTEFSNQLVKWFSHKEKMRYLIEDIELKFPLRYPIIQDGLDLHLNNKYASAVTLMLPQTEGILWDIGVENKLVERKYNSEKRTAEYSSSADKWKLQELSKQLFPQDKFHKIIVKNIFCEGPRNKILHGRNIYDQKQREISEWFSTLLILSLWRLSDEIKILKKSDKKDAAMLNEYK